MMAKYFLINQSGNVDEIGRIIRISENETIESFVKEKRFEPNTSCSEISFTEYKYYAKVEQSKRVKYMEDGLFAKICSLRPGDLCKAEIGNKFLKVKIIKNENIFGDIILKCKPENRSIIDVPAHCVYDVISIRDEEIKVDEALKKYELKENKELNHLCQNIDSPNFIVPLNILNLQDQMETVKDIYMVNPQTVKTYKGKNPKEKFIIFKCNGKKHCALLKWKGYINDKIYCLGCEIQCLSGLGPYGTNGTFGGRNLFECIDGCGVLIPLDRLQDCCVKDGHRELVLKRERIIEDSICCIKTTERSILNPRININERIKKRSSREIGIFRWVGLVNNKEVIGIDSNNLLYPGTDGSFCGVRLFDCNPKCGALFEPTAFAYELKPLPDINVNIIDPFNVFVIENGKEIRKEMYLNFKEKQPINIRWRGCVDGYLCVGCELCYKTEYGTNGTFTGQKLFTCGDRKAVLIPVEEIRERCEFGDHKDIGKFDNIFIHIWKSVAKSINPDTICCVEWLANIKRWPKLGVAGKMKYGSSEVPAICRWIGLVNGKEAVGVEMDIEFKGSNGRFAVFDLFTCPNGRGALFLADDIIHDIENEKLHFIDDKIVDVTKIYNIKSMNGTREKGISIGDPVMMKIPLKNHIGEVKWMGVINNEKCVGLDMEDRFDCAMNGIIKDKLVFKCLEGHGLVTPLTNVKLSEEAKRPQFMENGIINPNKYLKCEEQWNKGFLDEKKIKKDGFVFVVMRSEGPQVKKKGTLRWCGLMNQMPMAAVELTEDHEHGTDGTFWRDQLFKCPNKRAIAAAWNSIYQYLPYEQKIIPNEDRIFPEIDINSAVKYYLGCNDEVKDLYGTVKWSGIDEYGAYFYGLELEDKWADGTDGTFKGLRLFQCRPGHGILAPLDCVNKDLRFVESENELMNKYFVDLLRRSNDRDLQVQVLKDIMKMKNKRILKSFLEDKDHPVNLEVHRDLLPFLIREEYIELIQLLLNNCGPSPINSQILLHLANIAIRKDDENLLMCALEKCTDKNELLVNGETFLTNLFKGNISEEVINKLVKRKFFDANLTNKYGESPLTLACQRVMASTVKDLISHYPLSANQKQAATNLTLKAKDKLSGLNRSTDDVWKICEILNNAETSTLIECSICMDREVNVVFPCGHVSCDICARELVNCPSCNKDIGKFTRLYI